MTETAWHAAWKAQYAKAFHERTIGHHRADVCLPDGTVIEIQHSKIAEADIEERERFYGKMVWLVDARNWDIGTRKRELLFTETYGENQYGRYAVDFLPLRHQATTLGSIVKFRWRRPSRTWRVAKKPLCLDLGPFVLQVGRIHWDSLVGGWGQIISQGLCLEARRGP